MRPELIIDGARFSDYEGFVAEFNRAYLAAFSGPPWEGDISDLQDLLEAAREETGEPVTIRWIRAEKSRADLGHEQMAEVSLRQMASIPTDVFSPEGYELVHGWARRRLHQAQVGEGRTLFEWLVWQMDGEGDDVAHVTLE
jgi:hypothetical protein